MVLKYRPTINCTRALLKILQKSHSEIPLSVETLVGKSQLVIKRTVAPGYYLHMGLKENLIKLGKNLKSDKLHKIIIDVGFDGLPY